MKSINSLFYITLVVLLPSCGGSSSSTGKSTQLSLTPLQCISLGGHTVGDSGDGNVHRSGFICPDSGKPPLGTIDYSGQSQFPIEGGVCCGSSPEKRPTLTPEQCNGLGGVQVGDIGDGRIHRADYTCPDSGKSPIGTLDFSGQDVFPIEGAVCCGT